MLDSLIAAGASGLVIVLGGGWAAGPLFQFGPTYIWKATLWFAVTLAVVSARLAQHHPFPRFGLANHVTLIRAALLALVAASIGEPQTATVVATVVGIAIVMALLDGLDGRLARRTGMASAFGARFDMETDALLIMVLSVLVWRYGKAGAWVLLAGLMRYGFVAAGWLLPWMAGRLTPTRRAQTVAITTIVGLCLSLAPPVPPEQSAIVAAATVALLAWSFAIDVGRLWRQAK